MAFKPQTKPGAPSPTTDPTQRKVDSTDHTKSVEQSSPQTRPTASSPVAVDEQISASSEPAGNACYGSQNSNSNSSQSASIAVQAVAQEIIEEDVSSRVSEPQAKLEVAKTKLKVVVNNEASVASENSTHQVDEHRADNQAHQQKDILHKKQNQNDQAAEPESIPDAPQPVVKVNFNQVNKENWFDVVTGLGIAGHGLQILLNSTAEVNDGVLNISALEKIEPLMTDNAQQMIEEGLGAYFEVSKLKINYQFVESTSETPREKLARMHELALDEAEQALLNDPQIKFLLEQINAVLPRESIQLKN